jgi:hypothetical protein
MDDLFAQGRSKNPALEETCRPVVEEMIRQGGAKAISVSSSYGDGADRQPYPRSGACFARSQWDLRPVARDPHHRGKVSRSSRLTWAGVQMAALCRATMKGCTGRSAVTFTGTKLQLTFVGGGGRTRVPNIYKGLPCSQK